MTAGVAIDATDQEAERTMINVTEKAAEQIKIVRAKEGFDESHGLRVAAIGGGCSGLSYKLHFDKEVGEDDRVYEEKVSASSSTRRASSCSTARASTSAAG